MKKSSGIIAALLMVFCMAMLVVAPAAAKGKSAKPTKPAKTYTVTVKKVVVTKKGKVQALFKNAVKWDANAAVTITDASGEEAVIKASTLGKKYAKFKVPGLKPGVVYTLNITGIKDARAADEVEFGSISRIFSPKSFKKIVKSKKIDARKKMITVGFKRAVYFDKKVTAVVTDANGNVIKSVVKAKTKKSIRIKTAGLQKKVKYTVTVNGVKLKKDGEFGSVSYAFYRKK